MFTVVITEKGGAQRRMEFDKSEVTIGRVQGNDIILPKGNVSKRHSRIVLKDNRFIVVDLKSTNGTYVNGRKITSPLVVKPGDKIYIGDFIMTVEDGPSAGGYAGEVAASAHPSAGSLPAAGPSAAPAMSPERMRHPTEQGEAPPSSFAGSGAPPPLPSHSDSLSYGQPQQDRVHPSSPGVAPAMSPPPQAPPPGPTSYDTSSPSGAGSMAAPAQPAFVSPPPSAAPSPSPSMGAPSSAASMSAPSAGARARSDSAGLAGLGGPTVPPSRVGPPPRGLDTALRQVMPLVAQRFDVADDSDSALRNQDRWNDAHSIVRDAVQQIDTGNVDRELLVQTALREAVGLGPLEDLLSDDSVREIVVEGPGRVVADFGSGLEPVDGVFSSADGVITVARRLFAQAGDKLDGSRAIHQSALPYGPHVTVVLPPIAVRGPVIEVRRMGHGFRLDDLASKGMLDGSIADVLRAAVEKRRNVLVAGPLNSGVTTLVGALGSAVNKSERVVTVESVPDLVIEGPQVLSLGTGNPGNGFTLPEVVEQASRMRADRMVIDDIRGADVLDVLTTIASRASGNFVGVHSAPGQRAEEAIHGLVRLVGRGDRSAIQLLLDSAAHLVVQLDRDVDGVRRVQRVAEVTGGESNELFVHNEDGFKATGTRATFL